MAHDEPFNLDQEGFKDIGKWIKLKPYLFFVWKM